MIHYQKNIYIYVNIYIHILWFPGNSNLKYVINYASDVYFYKYINTNYKIDQRFKCASFIFKIQEKKN